MFLFLHQRSPQLLNKSKKPQEKKHIGTKLCLFVKCTAFNASMIMQHGSFVTQSLLFAGAGLIDRAYKRPTTSSSAVNYAYFATDGNPCTSTKTEPDGSQNWIKVDLEEQHDIYAVFCMSSKGRNCINTFPPKSIQFPFGPN